MRQSFKFPEPTLVALRKNGLMRRLSENSSRQATLYEHLMGYAPLTAHEQDNADAEARTAILNPQTGYMVNELASEETPKA